MNDKQAKCNESENFKDELRKHAANVRKELNRHNDAIKAILKGN